MSSDPPTSSEPGVTSQIQIDAECARFEQQWRAGQRPRIETFLEPHEEPLRSQLLRHLLHLEFEYRCGQAEQLDIEEYLRRFPHDHSLIQVVHDEHVQRQLETEPHKQADSGISQSDSSLHGRFLPGTELAGRYRIVSLLGKGGMGEVYRADDLKLGHTVALKFLPRALAADPQRLEYFHNEVRLTRQISHPNICRVYDISEVEGEHFLSMEYVDGEDLGVLLRRIGRLPRAKGVEIAQQLCAGLHAAHDLGVIHRDLKPANIMLDGRGQVRVTDFGLAKVVGDLGAARGGTPAYMAPEQRNANKTSVASDIYSLGLVLYELFTGVRVKDLREESSLVVPPSDVIGDIDPEVERVILQCLEREPEKRPRSVRHIATTLPGGEHLARWRATGEIPSPDQVAAAGGDGILQPRTSLALFVAVWLGLVSVFSLAYSTTNASFAGPPKHAAVLANKAAEILKALGCREDTGESANANETFGFVTNGGNLDRTSFNDAREATVKMGAEPILFWHRTARTRLIGESFFAENSNTLPGYRSVTLSDPPPTTPGMISLLLTPQGRLRQLAIETPITMADAPSGRSRMESELPLDEEALTDAFGEDTISKAIDFAELGVEFDMATVDTSGVVTFRPSVLSNDLRIKAEGAGGKLVRFRVFRTNDPLGTVDGGEWLGGAATFETISAMLLLASMVLSWRHLQTRRGDRRSAFRLALLVFLAWMMMCLLGTRHAPLITEYKVLILAFARSLYGAATFWLYYIALEPLLRRHSMETLISWTRLMSGRFWDPRVGRDVLVGSFAGILDMFLFQLNVLVPRWIGLSSPALIESRTESWLGPGGWLIDALHSQMSALYIGIAVVVLGLLMFNLILRVRWIADITLIAACSCILVMFYGNGYAFSLSWLFFGCLAAMVLFVFKTFGLLSVVTLIFVREILTFSVTSDPATWYYDTYLASVVLVGGIACLGFYTALGKQRSFVVSNV